MLPWTGAAMSNSFLALTVLVTAFLFLLVWTLTLLSIRGLLHAPSVAQACACGRAAVNSIALWLRRPHPFLHRRLRPGAFTGLPLTLFIIAALYLASLLAGLTHEVLEADETLRFDQAINSALGPWRQKPLISVFLWITQLGSGPALGAVAMTATAFLWADRRPALIVPLWLAFLGAQLTTWAGKYAIDRHRPELIEGVNAMSPSFPSGHATGAMAVYGFLAYAIARELPGWRPRFEVAFWSGVLILVIGFSRIYLSAHYLTDVAAGFLVGGFWLVVAFTAAEWTRGSKNS
jgi:membrane-associated phospholipid phosphatase